MSADLLIFIFSLYFNELKTLGMALHPKSVQLLSDSFPDRGGLTTRVFPSPSLSTRRCSR